MTAVLAVIGGAVSIGALLAGSAVLSGWVLTVLWGWFVVPTFHVQPLGVVPAIGLSMLVTYLTYHSQDVEEVKRSATERWTRVVITAIVRPALVLGFAWVVHLFMP